MPINPETGLWQPSMAPKQVDIFNCDWRYLLVSGPRLSGKSVGCMHRIIRHMWETDGAAVAVFSRTIKAATTMGSYHLMINRLIPEWLDADLVSEYGYKFQYATDGEPRMEGATRTHTFTIQNYYGTTSSLYLFSLDYDQDIAAKVRNTMFSMFYFIELDNFKTRDVFTITKAQLRMMPKIPFGKHQWIGDTNPADDGDASWIHKLFYQHDTGPEKDLAFTKYIKVIEVFIEDNTFLDQETVDDLKSSYAHDPDLYARYIEGKWTRATRDCHFSDVFLPNIHVRGDVSSAIPDNWQIIVPTETCIELSSGWDAGQVNHSLHIASKRCIGDNMAYDFIDELWALDRQISVADITYTFMERMDYWEQLLKDMYGRTKILWRHWSDSSALDYRAAAGAPEEKIVARISDGRILLRGIAKPRGSVLKRIEMVRRLLFENRLFVSAQLTHTIDMLHGLKKPKTRTEMIVYNDPLKHSFDSFSYLLSGEEPMDLNSRPNMVMPGLVSIPG